MLNVYLLEDDPKQFKYIQSLIRQIAREIRLTDVDVHAVKSLTAELPRPSVENVFILDLEINDNPKAGLEFSQRIRENDQLANIIFITVHDELVYTTYKYRVSALDFIAKDRGNIYNELKRDLAHINEELTKDKNKEMFTYREYNEDHSIPLDQICYIEANSHNSHSSMLYTVNDECIQINYNLHELEAMNDHFFRAHKSYLVNLERITSVNMLKRRVVFSNNISCPVSRRNTKVLLAMVKQGK